MKQFKLYLIGIDNTTNAKDIVYMDSSMLPEATMSIHEYDYESGVPREDKR